jgi:hypothetical protein
LDVLSSAALSAVDKFNKACWLTGLICAELNSNWICNDKDGLTTGAAGALGVVSAAWSTASTERLRKLRVRLGASGTGWTLSCSIICCALGVACAKAKELAKTAEAINVMADSDFFIVGKFMILKVVDYQ